MNRLEQALCAIGTLTDAEAIAQHQPAFQEADAALKAEPDAARRQQILDTVERLVPAGPARVFVLSFLVAASQDARHLAALHETVSRPPFTLQQRHFFYWQLVTRHAGITGAGTPDPAAVYTALLRAYRNALNIGAPWIEPADRDPDSVVVITNQLLGLQHAPTADCMDYCHVLQTRLKKKVLLINTADMPWTLALPYYDPIRFNYSAEYSKVGRLNFKGELIPFYQCRKPMPNLEETGAIVRTVLDRKPALVLSLGHSDVAADLCSEFVTVATMPFGTNLPRAKCNVYVLPRGRRPDDEAFMRQWQIASEQIVETEYTFRLPERSASFTRADLRLPENAYVIAIVGNRLDDEIADDVADDLARLLEDVPQAFLAFMGTFPQYPRLARRHAVFAKRSVFLGHHKDVLAVYEHCQAYFNPPRYGGGSSAAFALGMGIPVLTEGTGDVANIAGPRFVLASRAEVAPFVRRAVADPEHRREWAAAARARFAEISNREAMLQTILEGARARASRRVML